MAGSKKGGKLGAEELRGKIVSLNWEYGCTPGKLSKLCTKTIEWSPTYWMSSVWIV